MSRAILAFFLFAAICTLLLSAGTFRLAHEIYQEQHTDNQTIAALRAQNAELKRDLQDTEQALDKAALEGSRLGQEIEVLRYDLERATKRPRL